MIKSGKARVALAVLLPSIALAPAAATETAFAQDYSEDDKLDLAEAETACAEGNSGVFIMAFVRSRAVQQQYLADTINVGPIAKSKKIPKKDYGQFPIAMMEGRWVAIDPASEVADLSRPQPIEPYFVTNAQTEAETIEWQRMEQKDPSSPDMRPVGKPGRLVFQRTKSCWQLTDDLILEELTKY
jgi:hypothetical protein